MNPISRLFIVLYSWIFLGIITAIFIIPDVLERPLWFFVYTVTLTPLIVATSFSIDIFVSRKKWKPRHKILKISIVYSLILVYIILHFESIVYAFTNIINIEQWFDSMPDYRLIIN